MELHTCIHTYYFKASLYSEGSTQFSLLLQFYFVWNDVHTHQAILTNALLRQRINEKEFGRELLNLNTVRITEKNERIKNKRV